MQIQLKKGKTQLIQIIIKKNNPLNKEKSRIKCCLVKKHYHVKGEIIVIKRKIKDFIFEIIFCSDSDNNGETCNKGFQVESWSDSHNKG